MTNCAIVAVVVGPKVCANVFDFFPFSVFPVFFSLSRSLSLLFVFACVKVETI